MNVTLTPPFIISVFKEIKAADPSLTVTAAIRETARVCDVPMTDVVNAFKTPPRAKP